MTVPQHYDTGEHHIGMNAAMAAFVALLVTVAGLTIWQADLGTGGGSSSPDIVEVEGGERTQSPDVQARYANPGFTTAATRYGVSIAPDEWSLPDVNEIRSNTGGTSPFAAANSGPGGHSLAVPENTGISPAKALADFGTPEAAGGLPDLPTINEAAPTQGPADYPAFGLAESPSAQQLDCSYWSVCDDGPVENPNAGSRVQ